MPRGSPNGGRRFTWSGKNMELVIDAIRASSTMEEAVARASRATGWPLAISSIGCALRTAGKPTMGQLLRPPEIVATAPKGPPRELPDLDWDDDEQATRPNEAAQEPEAVEESAPAPEPEPSADDMLRGHEERTVQARKDRQIEQLLKELKAARSRQSFIDAASSFRAPPQILARETSSKVRELTAVALASDWHVEEPVFPEAVAYRNGYNLDVAAMRVERFFRGIIWHITHHRASGRLVIRDLVLWLGGDLMTGYIHPELVEGNQLSPTETVRWLLPRLRDGIATLLDQLDLVHIEIPCSYGNHGRTTDKPRIATGAENNFEWLMYHSLADEFRGEPRVHFEITRSAHQYVDVYGQLLHFHHGDDVKYMGGVGGLGIPLLKAVPLWEKVQPAAVHCIGHHHILVDYGRVVVNGSLIGFGPYSQRIRAPYEPPQQALFYMDRERGKCMPSSIWVDGSEERALWPMPEGRAAIGYAPAVAS